MSDDKYPTLHAIGLGPQLDAMERICADSAAGKHAGEPVMSKGIGHHFRKAGSHMARSGYWQDDRDESGEFHLIHAAARLLMAAACAEASEV